MLANDQVLNKGRYRIVGNFGQKGTLGIYEAYDTVSNTSVVLRETVGNHGAASSISEMDAINGAFMDRAKALSEVRHKSLVCVQDFFADIDRQYLVLEPVSGIDLSTVITTGSERPAVADVLSWADQLLDALQFLHSQKTPIIHGDINPENVKLAPDSTVKLLISSDQAVAGSSINIAAVRPEGEVAVNYRPLEQLWAGLDALSQRVILNSYNDGSEKGLLQPLSPASDIYSLGATLYAALTGLVPPDALDRSIAALEGKADPLKDPSSANGNVPPEISEVILKAMALKREDRFYSAVILRQVLRTATVRVKEREAGIVEAPAAKTPTPALTPVPSQAVTDSAPKAEAPTQYSGPDRRRAEQPKAAPVKSEEDVLGLLDLLDEPVAAPRVSAENTQTSELPTSQPDPHVSAPSVPATELHVSESPASATAQTASVSEAKPEVAAPAIVSNASPTISTPFDSTSSDHSPTPQNRMIMIAGAAVVAIIAMIGIYMFAFSGSEPAKPAASSITPASSPTETPLPSTTEVESAVPTETLNAAGEPTSDQTETTAAKTAKPNQPTAKPEPTKKPAAAPAPAKTPKKVTMDDLLN